MSCATTAASTMSSGSRADPTVVPDQRLDKRLEAGFAASSSSTRPSSSSAAAVIGFGHVDARHVLDPGPAVDGRPPHAGHQAIVELEGGAGQVRSG